jgi:hypothetical protein
MQKSRLQSLHQQIQSRQSQTHSQRSQLQRKSRRYSFCATNPPSHSEEEDAVITFESLRKRGEEPLAPDPDPDAEPPARITKLKVLKYSLLDRETPIDPKNNNLSDDEIRVFFSSDATPDDLGECVKTFWGRKDKLFIILDSLSSFEEARYIIHQRIDYLDNL